jgi:CRISPR-associated protein Csd1
VATNDEGVQAVLRFLERVSTGEQKVELPDDCKSNELFAFVFAPDVDVPVHDRPKFREYWRDIRKTPAGNGEPTELHCLVTGDAIAEIGLFPLIKRVPGGKTTGVGLVSFNNSAFWSHGWENNENAPIGRSAADACRDALNRLLDPAYPDPKNPQLQLPPRNIRLSVDAVICYWARGKQGGMLADILSDLLNSDDPNRVADVYLSVWTGRQSAIDNPSAFYAVTLTGAQGRVIVRDWFESTVGQVMENLDQHFGDLRIVRNSRRLEERPLPLRVLLRSLAPLGDEKGIPDALAADFVHAALQGRAYPLSLLQKAIERTRAEIGRSEWSDLERRDARAALVKAVLNRRRRHEPATHVRYQEVDTTMNPNNDSPGYALGALIAVLERLQALALGDVNASLVDRYFSAASATPRGVFVRLLRNSLHHSRKAQDLEEGRERAQAFRCNRLIDAIVSRFDVDRRHYPPQANGLPAHLDLEQQGLFVLGYHQMRYWLFMSNEERAAWEAAHPDAPRAFRWLAKTPQAEEETAPI